MIIAIIYIIILLLSANKFKLQINEAFDVYFENKTSRCIYMFCMFILLTILLPIILVAHILRKTIR